MSDPDLLTLDDVAGRLKVSYRQVQRLTDAGKLLTVRIGFGRGSKRVTEDEYARFVAAGQQREAPSVAAGGSGRRTRKPPRLRVIEFIK